MAIFCIKYLLREGRRRRKNEKKLTVGQLVTGSGRDAGGTGQGWRRPGGMSGGPVADHRRSGGGGPGGGYGAE